ncbi:MAG: LecA/PA-IL family lectin [Acidobacteriota bacterium]
MLKVIRPVRLFMTLGLIVTLSVISFADTLRLKDGSIIKGRIVTFGGGKFTVVVGDGSRQRQMTFDAGEVESIQFDSAGGSAATVSERPTPQKKDPQFIETSTPPKNVPRVITTDNTTASAPRPSPAKEVPQPKILEPSSTAGRKPVEVSVKVLADNSSNGWTNSGWVVRKGQKIRISGDGSISIGNGKSTGPSGLYDVDDPAKLLKSVPTGALIAVIGDDNNEFIYVGSERTFTAARDGALFLGVNEGNLDDNSGAFDVRVEIDPS